MNPKIYLIVIFSAMFFFSSLACCEDVSYRDNFINGTWTGKGFQDDGSTWTIALVVNKGVFNISYPSLNCGGLWTVQKSDSNRMWFIETITYGKGDCISNGRVVITRINEKYITFTWFYPNGKLGAFSTLINE